MPGVITRPELTDDENRVLRATCLLSGLATVVTASYTFMLPPMLEGLGGTPAQSSLLRAVPSVGSLLVIFPAGILGQRLGPRRLLGGAGALIALGALLVCLAPAVPVVTAGMLLSSIGRSALFVVVIALLTAATTRDGARAVAFSAYGTVGPAVYLVVPVLAGLLLTVAPWRTVAGLWVLSGVAAMVVARRLLPPDGARPATGGELWTPALAGLVLTCLVQVAATLNRGGGLSTAVLIWAAALLASFAGLVLLLRHLPSPTLSLDALRGGGLTLLLLVVLLIPFANLWYYATVGLEYVYGRSSLGAALLVAPAQLSGVVGAYAVKGFVKAKGITVAGTTLLLATSVVMFLTCLQSVTTPVVVAVSVLCLYGATTAALPVPLSTAIMNRASPGTEGSVASFRGAAGSLGGALGVIFMSTAVSIGAHRAYTNHGTDDLDRTQVMTVLHAIRDGEVSQDAVARYGVPEQEIETLSTIDEEIMVGGYRAQGLGGGIVTLVAAGVFYATRRRHGED